MRLNFQTALIKGIKRNDKFKPHKKDLLIDYLCEFRNVDLNF